MEKEKKMIVGDFHDCETAENDFVLAMKSRGFRCVICDGQVTEEQTRRIWRENSGLYACQPCYDHVGGKSG